ncbi:MAG: FecR domain-containing protein [Myxococcales bacterium]|nr:FecR domain-containing protein [Myxococcales bacterium]
MTRHETDRLWALAADELELDDRRYVELHLSDCPECTDSLEAVRIARRALASARHAAPAIDWVHTDERVGALVEKRMRSMSRPGWFPFAVAGALVATAAAVTVVFWPSQELIVEPPPTEPPLVQLVAPKPIRVELARSLTRVSAESEPVLAGETLKSGDVLRTGIAGRAFVHLSDSSHVRVSASTQVALTRADPDDVVLTVTRGRVAVRASHEARKSFVVHAGDVSVSVVGTVFSVSNGADGVEVAVAEGEVRVASGESGQSSVLAGQRMLIDPRGKVKVRTLTPALERELSEVQGLAEAVTRAEQPPGVVVAAKGGQFAAPRTAPGPLPRLTPEESKARVVEPEAMVAPVQAPAVVAAPEAPAFVSLEPETQVEVERIDGPGTVFPSLAGGYTRGVPFKREELAIEAPAPKPSAPAESGRGPASDESEWSTLPKPAPAAVVPPASAPLPAMLIVPSLEPVPAPVAPAPQPAPVRTSSKSLEQLFLEKAETSLEKGGCDRYLPGLEDIVIEGQDAAQLARVLRARCFDVQLRPRQAMSEYVKYLEAFPKGRFAGEARAALGQESR